MDLNDTAEWLGKLTVPVWLQASGVAAALVSLLLTVRKEVLDRQAQRRNRLTLRVERAGAGHLATVTFKGAETHPQYTAEMVIAQPETVTFRKLSWETLSTGFGGGHRQIPGEEIGQRCTVELEKHRSLPEDQRRAIIGFGGQTTDGKAKVVVTVREAGERRALITRTFPFVLP